MSDRNLPWSQLYQARREVQKKYKKIWKVPISKRYSTVLFDQGRDGMSVLEIGAGTRGLQKKVTKHWSNVSYKSMDIDDTNGHDFNSLEEIAGEYDMICMFEVIEHVRPEHAYEILSRCKEILKPGGLLLVSTPNIYHPPTFLRDATHITPWCYDELGAIAMISGFKIKEIYRLYHDSLVGRLLHRVLLYPLHKAMSLDFSKQVILVAEV